MNGPDSAPRPRPEPIADAIADCVWHIIQKRRARLLGQQPAKPEPNDAEATREPKPS